MHVTASPPPSPSTRWDPWFHIYFGATMGCVDCFEGSLRHNDKLPLIQRGDAWAITARGWWALGRPEQALSAWEKAERLGGPEVEALRPFLAFDARAAIERRARSLVNRGLAADAWCDVAALAVRDKDVLAARSAIARAQAVCPDHAEARHWVRALDSREFLEGAGRSRRTRGLRNRPRRSAVEVDGLMPLEANGWVSPERHSRRHMAPKTPAPPGSALERLVAAGAHSGWLLPEEDWAAIHGSDPDVELELALDQLVALGQEDRPLLDEASRTWDVAVRSGARRAKDVGHLLCAVAARHEALWGLACTVADAMLAFGPDPWPQAWRAWFGARLGQPGAVAAARAVLEGPIPHRLPWRLALSALYIGGAAAEGAAVIRDALTDPERRDWARAVSGKRGRPADVWVAIVPRYEFEEPNEAWF